MPADGPFTSPFDEREKEGSMTVSSHRLNQLANDPLMCNITPEVQECLRELIALRAAVDEPAEMCENCDDNYLPSTMRTTEDDVRLCRRCWEACCEESRHD